MIRTALGVTSVLSLSTWIVTNANKPHLVMYENTSHKGTNTTRTILIKNLTYPYVPINITDIRYTHKQTDKPVERIFDEEFDNIRRMESDKEMLAITNESSKVIMSEIMKGFGSLWDFGEPIVLVSYSTSLLVPTFETKFNYKLYHTNVHITCEPVLPFKLGKLFSWKITPNWSGGCPGEDTRIEHQIEYYRVN